MALPSRQGYPARREAGESVEDKEQKLIDGIRTHYAAVATLAEQKREELGTDIPIVAMGHLFTAGRQTVEAMACVNSMLAPWPM